MRLVGLEPGDAGRGAAAGGSAAAQVESGEHSLISVTIAGAVGLDAGSLRAAVCGAYLEVRRLLGARNAVRYWNFIPRIHDRMGEGDRYMVFNEGRFEALAAAADATAGSPTFATASGVGYRGEDLVIHCLASRSPGAPVENPRQVPAYRYSARYGARPPCFSRATTVELGDGGGSSLLIAGTASVVGEDSLHADDLRRQLTETFTNLDALLRAWAGGGTGTRKGRGAALTSLRIYHVFESHREAVVEAVRARFPVAVQIETVVADICRPELLVEIEGVARMAEGRGTARHG